MSSLSLLAAEQGLRCEAGTAEIHGAPLCSLDRYDQSAWGDALLVRGAWWASMELWLAHEVDIAGTPGVLPCSRGRDGRNPLSAMARGGQKIKYPAGSIE
jgi:hypothetical protein